MSKSNLIDSLFKIDAAEGFVRYVSTVKPYHSKILDVLIEYIYKEDIRATVTEKWTTGIQQFKPTSPVVWDPITEQYVTSSSMCYFQAIEADPLVYPNAVVIKGHNQEKFRSGDRISVAFIDGTKKIFIVDHATNTAIIEPTDPYYTIVSIVATQTVPATIPTTVQLSFTNDYKIVGAVTGSSGAWIVDGDHRDEFQIGENIIVANTAPNDLGASVYTITSISQGYVPHVVVDTVFSVEEEVLTEQPIDSQLFVVGDYIEYVEPVDDVKGYWKKVPTTNPPTITKDVVTEVGITKQVNVGTPATPNIITLAYFKRKITTNGNSITIPDATVDYSVVGVRPTRTITFEPDGFTPLLQSAWYQTPGQWIVLGQDVSSIIVGSHISVSNEPNTKTYYTVSSVVATTFNALSADIVIPEHVDYLTNSVPPTPVLIITIDPAQEIPETAQPRGTLQSPVFPEYEIIGHTATSWIIAGQYADRFIVSDRLFVVDNIPDANGRYTIQADATYDPVANTTIINVGAVIPEAAPIGTIQHPTTSTTIMSVDEPVFESPSLRYATFTNLPGNYPDIHGDIVGPLPTTVQVDLLGSVVPTTSYHNYIFITEDTGKHYRWNEKRYQEIDPPVAFYKAFGAGTLRPLPLVIKQVAEPTTTVIGAVWLDPITNASQRWDGTDWVHNYTSTQYSWFDLNATERSAVWTSESDSVDPHQVVIKSATAQPIDGTDNSFVVDTDGLFQPYTITATSLKSNQFIFSHTYNVVSVDPYANTWTVSGIVSVSPGETIYVTSSSTTQGQGAYVVAEVTQLATTTVIKVVKQISRLSAGDGLLSVPANTNTLPRMVTGTRVKITSTVDLPEPLSVDQTYYFIPVIASFGDEVPATFALSKVRTPRAYEDYIDITTLGSGIHTLTQDEIYVPGTRINVRDTYRSRNNGQYTVSHVETSPTTSRVFVNERIAASSPASLAVDGVMTYDLDSHVFSSLTERACTERNQSEIHAATQIREFISFEFTMEDFDHIGAWLLENEPPEPVMYDFGYDIPPMDTSGWDGSAFVTTSIPLTGGAAGNTFVHNMLPIGFDTQYFDVGGIDESLASVAKKYGYSVP